MAAGGPVTETESVPGPTLYMCCIHPWMHAVINVSRSSARTTAERVRVRVRGRLTSRMVKRRLTWC
jgi:hypothetical protein